MMQLQRQHRARLDGQALNLKAITRIDAVIAAPGARHFAMQRVLIAAFGFEAGHQLLDVLHAIARRDHDGVFGLDHHVIAQAHCSDQAAFGMQVAAGAVLGNDVAHEHVAIGIGRRGLVQGIPGTHIAPTGVQGHDHGIGGFFHHRIVDGNAAAELEGGLVDAHEVQVWLCGKTCGARSLGDVGCVSGQFFEVAAGLEQKHAAVPVVLARVDKLLGAGEVGLLDKLRDGIGTALRRTATDVAIAGFGGARHDAKGDQATGLGSRHSQRDGGLKRSHIADDMVSGQHQQQRVRIGGKSCQRDGRGGVATDGFEHDGARLDAQQAQLLGHQKAMRVVTHNHRRTGF